MLWEEGIMWDMLKSTGERREYAHKTHVKFKQCENIHSWTKTTETNQCSSIGGPCLHLGHGAGSNIIILKVKNSSGL